MNILIVNQTFEVKGGSDVIARLSQKVLQEAGHRVHYFAALGPGVTDDGVHPHADHFFAPSLRNVWRFFYSPEARRRLERFLDENPIDVAHLHIHYGTLTSSILAPLKRRGIRIVQHLHEYRSYCSVSVPIRAEQPCSECRVGYYLPGLRHRCNRGSLLRSAVSTTEMYVADGLGAKTLPDLFLTVSEFQRRTLIAQGMPAEKLCTLYNPVHEDFFKVEAQGDGGVLFVGRIEDYKGVFDVLEVAARLPDVPFRIVGSGNAEARLRAEIASRGLSNVTLTGAQSRAQVLEHLAWAGVCLVPSRWHETFGLTAAEAMAAGVPVIVTRMGGLPEVVEEGVSGFVVEMGDVEAIALFIERMQRDEILGVQLKEHGRRRAQKTFSEAEYSRRLYYFLSGTCSDV